MSISDWLDRKYGRLLTREELRATLDFSGIDWYAAFHPPRQFPPGFVREYDPTGEYTYYDQNPKFMKEYA